MDVSELLIDGFSRVSEEVHHAVDGLTAEELAVRLAPDANSIAWLVWHLTRVQDDHLAAAFAVPQVWLTQGWAERFALPLPATAIGYGHSSAEVATVTVPDGALLLDYYDAVHAQTVGLVATVAAADLDRIVDERWGGVSLGVRLVSVISDDLQHVGQAAFIRGVLRHEA